jgi:hypothetical protein
MVLGMWKHNYIFYILSNFPILEILGDINMTKL